MRHKFKVANWTSAVLLVPFPQNHQSIFYLASRDFFGLTEFVQLNNTHTSNSRLLLSCPASVESKSKSIAVNFQSSWSAWFQLWSFFSTSNLSTSDTSKRSS